MKKEELKIVEQNLWFGSQMKNLVQVLQKVSLSWLAILVIGFFVIDRHLQYELWDKADGVIVSDAKAYYGYLPAFFIEDDISLSFAETNSEKAANYWYNQFGETRVIKMTSGLSILSLPFFLVPYLMNEHQTGFEPPFKLALIVSALFYLFLGFIFLRKLLVGYFSELVTGITLILIGMGTNIWYYSIEEVFMSHIFSFSLISLFLCHTIADKSKYKGVLWWIVFGILIGLIALIRPTNSLILIVPILYKQNELLSIIRENYGSIALSILCAIIVWMPQLIYWKMITGNLFFFSYGEEGFDFLSPALAEGLFGFRKGFFIYTPLMFLILPGIWFVKKRIPKLFLPSLVFMVLNIYVIFSWWCWWYGGSFGARPMIDSFALNALLIAICVEAILNWKYWISIPLMAVLLGGIQLNRYQTQQYRWKIIHWDAMTKEAYFFTLLESPEAPEVERTLEHPEY